MNFLGISWGPIAIFIFVIIAEMAGMPGDSRTMLTCALCLLGFGSAMSVLVDMENKNEKLSKNSKFKRTKDYRISWDGEKITARPLSFKPAKFEEEENEDE